MKRPFIIPIAIAGALAIAGCSGADGGGSETSASSSATDGKFIDGATFTMSLAADPGALDPQLGPGSPLAQVAAFGYDSLVSIDKSGSIQSQLASAWTVDKTELTFTLNDGIICADGSDFTADTVVKNIEFVADPANASPFLGVYVPPGTTAAAKGNIVTVTLAAPAPFAINGFANLAMVCDAGLADRSTLVSGMNGTGAYELVAAIPNDQYTFTKRDDYAWGPGGATTAESGLPASVVVRIIENATTAANLLANGETNAGTIVGPDSQRLIEAGLFSTQMEVLFGQQWYNQGDGRVTSDPAVRMALTQSIDLAEVAQVATAGTGTPPTTFAVIAPVACTGDSVSASLPGYDANAAAQALDDAGWVAGSDGVRAKDGTPLAITFKYNSALGPNNTAAAELVAQQWESIGVSVTAIAEDPTRLQEALFGTGDWDVAWITINVSAPDQLVGLLSGEAPTNFAKINNEAYNAGVAQALTEVGADSCPAWLEAESNLVKDADVIPIVNDVVNTFGNKAEFQMSGVIIPTSIRMLG